MSAKITIENCLDCPHVIQGRDPDPHDSFNMDDMYSACKKVSNPKQDKNSIYAADRQSHRAITVAARPYQLRKESEVPSWCPFN